MNSKTIPYTAKLINIFTSYSIYNQTTNINFKLNICLETYQSQIKKFIFSILFFYFLTVCTSYTALFGFIKHIQTNFSNPKNGKRKFNIYKYQLQGFVLNFAVKKVLLKKLRPLFLTKSGNDIKKAIIPSKGIQITKLKNINIYSHRYNHKLIKFTNRVIKQVTIIFTVILKLIDKHKTNQYIFNAIKPYLFRK